MNKEFDRQFRHDDFGRGLASARRAIMIMSAAFFVFGLGILGLIVWGMVLLLRYFGVV